MKTTAAIGPFVLIEELAAGSLGRRHLARAESCPEREVVIESVSIQADDETFDRALRRLDVMTTIQHDHLVPLIDAGFDGDQIFIATPTPDQSALDAIPLGPSAADVVHAVALGVAHLHERGVLHRDIRPRHVGWYGETVRLGGLAFCEVDTSRTCGAGPIGALSTMAPSIVLGRPASIGSDVYALGALLHELATGTPVHPHAAESLPRRLWRIAHSSPSLDSSLPAALEPVVEHALNADGSDDPHALDRFLDDLSALTHSPTPGARR